MNTHLAPTNEIESRFPLPPVGHCVRCNMTVYSIKDPTYCKPCFDEHENLRSSLLCSICPGRQYSQKLFSDFYDYVKSNDSDIVASHIWFATTEMVNPEKCEVGSRFCLHSGANVMTTPIQIWAHVSKLEVLHVLDLVLQFHTNFQVLSKPAPESMAACDSNDDADLQFTETFLGTTCPRASFLMRLAFAAVNVTQFSARNGGSETENSLFLSTLMQGGNYQARKHLRGVLRARLHRAKFFRSNGNDVQTTKLLWNFFIDTFHSKPDGMKQIVTCASWTDSNMKDCVCAFLK